MFVAFFEARKEAENMFAVGFDLGLVFSGKGAERQILIDGQVRENPATFRNEIFSLFFYFLGL